MAIKMLHFEIIPFENIVVNSLHHLLRITNLLLENLRELKIMGFCVHFATLISYLRQSLMNLKIFPNGEKNKFIIILK